MQEQPTAIEILGAVSRFLRTVAVPQLSGHAGFTARVAANAVDLVAREIALRPDAEAAEMARLAALLGAGADAGNVAAMNDALAGAIRAGRLTEDDPALIDHLWQTTMDKLAIDQPGYASYRAELERGEKPGESL
ncbi:DUF6285 domain-containing protein [Sandaracinobacteroides sp. A072]|uniref:DUF6285 domain-containing protein n=1 Tax=Sandaracinobacteroides sp. A072 TaxID=3461146 RepID=UPI004042819B